MPGLPTTLYPNLPRLTPNLDSLVITNGVQQLTSPGQRATQVNATVAATVGGTVTTGDTVALTLTNAGAFAAQTVTYTVLAADTVKTIAEGLAALLNANATLQAAGVYATTGTDTGAHEAVLTVNWPSPVGNSAVLTKTLSGGATETVTIANSGALSGGSGAVVPTQNFQIVYNNTVTQFFQGQSVLVDAAWVAAIMPIIPVGYLV